MGCQLEPKAALARAGYHPPHLASNSSLALPAHVLPMLRKAPALIWARGDVLRIILCETSTHILRESSSGLMNSICRLR